MLTINLLRWVGMPGGRKHTGLPALAICRVLIKMVAGLQQHRGLSSGWLAGDQSFEGRMLQRRQAIEALLPAMREGFQRETEEACPCFTENDWKLFRFKWREIVDDLAQASFQDNIEKHNQLIARALDWLSAVGESRIELPAGCHLPRGVVRNFAVHLPALSECLGQARALGCSVAAKGSCSSVAKVRLSYLVARAEALLERTSSVDQTVAGDLQGMIRVMAAMVRNELLSGAGVTVSPEHYFDTATRAIDALFSWIEQLGDVVEKALREGGWPEAKLALAGPDL